VAGSVVKVGDNVEKFRVGDRVAATHHVPCNTCRYCLDNEHTMCDTLLKGTHFEPGGFAEYVRVPAINVDRGVFLIPDDVSYEEASFMEPLACVLRGQRKLRMEPGQSVLVLGSGIAGLLHTGLSRALGAGLIIAYDSIPFRLNMAEEMGASLVIDACEDLPEKIREANNGRLADRVILCYDGFLPHAFECVERGGTVLLFSGAAEEATIPGRVNDIFWRTEVTLTSSYAGSPSDCRAALDIIRAGTIPIKKLITSNLSLEQGPQGFKEVANPIINECIKVIIKP
jgi:L-iditol 2-dehydrogenase